MYIEEVIIDGFKSYASRTVVSGFDPSFNAITGMNGSGKSNVLDAICFVLGISNLSQVRVSNLQELVYKGGQAGITKATVSIVFNNQFTADSPVGYEDCGKITITRQIVLGGRNKYFINGHVAQPSRVQNLFHSVQLNVNNPHFLIMQGRITKVINMKPPEVLGMIEEAAGTRMYEVKKEAALKTIDKKQRKVEEIEQVLATEITPMLEKLRNDRSSYMKWCTNNTRLERLERLIVALDYTRATSKVTQAQEERQQMHAQHEEIRAASAALQEEVDAAEKSLERLTNLREQEVSGGLRTMEEQVQSTSKLLVQKTSEWTNKKESLDGERMAAERVQRDRREAESQIDAKEKELEHIQAAMGKLEEDVQRAVREEEAAQRAILTGSGNGGDNGDERAVGSSVEDQIHAARRAVSSADSDIKQAQMRLEHLREDLKAKTAELKSNQKAIDRVRREQMAADKSVQQVKLKMHELDYSEEEAARLRDLREREELELQKLRDRFEQLSAQLSAFEFRYSDPERNFDRRKVKGFVASLLTVKNSEYSTAIEVAAGGCLYQVVVDSDQTGKALLQNGRLQRRVTIIPLNRIHATTVTSTQLTNAMKIDPSANVALSLVGHDDEVEEAMKYVFGRTIVCRDMDSAKQVTFHPQIRCRTVTLEGDLFDPSGTLTGGGMAKNSSAGRSSLLEQLTELNRVKSAISLRERALKKATDDLSQWVVKERAYATLKRQLELCLHEVKLVEERLQGSAAGRLVQDVAELEAEVNAKLPQAIEAAGEKKKASASRVKELESSLKEGESAARARAMREAENCLEGAKRRRSQLQVELRQAKERVDTLKVEMEVTGRELVASKAVLDAHLESIASIDAECQALEGKVARVRADFDAQKASYEEERSKLAENDRSIAVKSKARDEIVKKLEECTLELQKMEHRQKAMIKDHEGAEKLVRVLEEKYDWIRTDRSEFGVAGGEYDFDRVNANACNRERDQLREEQGCLSRKINKKVMTLFEKAEQEYQELTSRKRIIENDKRKMASVIQELDRKKKHTLESTWKKVNTDFASIFSSLLPGATAKLEPPEGCSVMDGLEIRVGFGSVWKDSLSELSGGQKSLIALSLVLAMLLFKPAPMYILDEVDAALDLSHTQNIGIMLKNHFQNAQFIVVSLKEGMFNNANVIFRTKFVDGISTIGRTAGQRQPSSLSHQQTRRGRGNGKQTLRTEGARDKENVYTEESL